MRLDGGAIFKIAIEKNAQTDESKAAKAEAEAKIKEKKQEERAQAAKTLRKIKKFGL